ncbi:hypothetical protein MASR1M45_25170 [Candidatus Kapaibacterium sp.]
MIRNLLIAITTLLLIASCGPKKTYLTPLEIENEKNAVKQVMNDYHRAFEKKDFGKVVETLADEVIFFGTDSSEVYKTFADFKKAIEKQWQYYDRIRYGDIVDESIQMDDNGTIATIIYGVKAEYIKGDSTQSYYLRISRVLKKKNNKWLLAGGLVGIVREDDPQYHANPNGQ